MKRYLLTGNGINIQFDHKNYSAQEIVLRVLKNCDRDDFPSHIIVDFPYLLKNYLGLLFIEAREAIKGKYDNYAFRVLSIRIEKKVNYFYEVTTSD